MTYQEAALDLALRARQLNIDVPDIDTLLVDATKILAFLQPDKPPEGVQ